ncbi:coiled-coil domain-containing protein 73 [Anomaloglossus baeobatrachus]|uniref:coiled-coil domain-containing protein 73 n=1 Tax=Anomaloglossus baeobatrachus TaxID=238106 RepID=UPI003F50561A
MEQKLQLHILAKEDHIKQLGECKKCIENVTQQFGMIKEVHEMLEQTAKAAIQTNKKLDTEISQKNNELEQLKEELKKLSSDFLNYKVTFKQRAKEDNISISEQYVKELKERLQTETEINKKLMEVNANMKEGKQTLERDNELQRAKATENEEKFLTLRNEHEHALTEWRAQKESLDIECETVRKELDSIKELNHNPHKYSGESPNKTPKTIIQDEEHQSRYNMCDVSMCDKENITYEHIIQNNLEVNKTSHVSSSENGNLSLTCNKIQKMDGSKVEMVQKDANNIQYVYNITDKGHLSEEQKDESCLSENKVDVPIVEQNIRGSLDGKCTEEIPVNMGCHVVDEYVERMAKLHTTVQKKVMAMSMEMLPDNNKLPAVCSEEASLQTDSSHCKSEDGTSREVYIVVEKPDRTGYDRGDLINEVCSEESQLLNKSAEQLIYEQGTTRDSAPTGNGPSCALKDGNYHLSALNRETSAMSTKSCSHDHILLGIEEPMLQKTENPHGVCAHSLFSKLTEKIDLKSVEIKDIAKHCMDMVTLNTSITNLEKGEIKTKCLGQEIILTLSPQYPVGNLHLQSALDLKQGDSNIQSLHYTENTDVFNVKNVYLMENCTLDTRKDTNIEETVEDVNEKSKLCTDNLTDQTSDPGKVGDKAACIEENDNIAAGCMSQEFDSMLSDEKSGVELSSKKEEKSKPSGKSPINPNNLAKLVYLPGSNLRDGLNILPINETKLSGQDLLSKDEHVSKNADQAFYNSSIPRRATSLENSDLVEKKQNLCPAVTDSMGSSLINLPNATGTEVTVSNKDNYDISSIQRQISAIERFLFNNKLNGSRKRKSEDTGIQEE